MSDDQDPGLRKPHWARERLDESIDLAAEGVRKTRIKAEEWAAGSREWLEARKRNLTNQVGDADDLRIIKAQGSPLYVPARRKKAKLEAADVAGIAAFAVAAGILANETEITRFTRGIMDSDSAPLQRLMQTILDPQRASEINAWMDQVPGSVAGGGWAHRLHHGHDVQSLVVLIEQEGVGAAAHWMNHIYLRDFWTPHGVPWLPGGSGDAYEVMVSLGVSPSTALDLLAINAAEAAGFTLFTVSMWRLGVLARTHQVNRDYARQFEATKAAVLDGSPMIALERLRGMELRPDEAVALELRLQAATLALDKASDPSLSDHDRAEWAATTFSTAEAICQRKDKVVPFMGETRTSAHGLATILLCNAAARLKHDGKPRDYMRQRAVVGLNSLIGLAEKQMRANRLTLDRGFRPYSAVMNLELCLQITRAFEYSGAEIPGKHSRTLLGRRRETLQAAFKHLGEEHKTFIRKLWKDREGSPMPSVA